MMTIISKFIAENLFIPLLFLTNNTQEVKYCTSNNDCNLGFNCSKHLFYEYNICKTNDYYYLRKLTPVLIDSYGFVLGMQPEMLEMLQKVSKRESNNKFWEHHWHKSDIRAVKSAFKRLNIKNSQHNKKMYQGYGLFGQNSAIFMQYLDKNLPPQVLKHPFYAMLAYKNAADKAYYKIKKGVLCNGHKFYGSYQGKVTLSDIHNAVNGGKICPRHKSHSGERWLKNNIPFVYTTHYIP